MGWRVPRAASTLLMLMVMCFAPVASVIAQQPDFNATLKAAEQGNPAAQFNLGIMYEHGRGVTLDYGKAGAWYQKAAEQGLADAQVNRGFMYDQGQGVAQDYDKARAWYQKAAEQGDAKAQLNLSSMYAGGHGRRADFVQAYKWAALSAQVARHWKEAKAHRDGLEKKMTPAQLAEAKRLVAEWKRKKAGRGGVAKN